MATIVVTGAASGIGAATTRRLRDQGDTVVTVDLHHADIECDLGTPDGREAAVIDIGRRCERLDGLVPCSGLGPLSGRPGSLLASVNYFGTVALLEELRPLLACGQDAAAVAISSNSTTIQPGWSATLVEACLAADETHARALADACGSVAAYPATKVAVARWVRRHAVTSDWAGAGIRLNAVAPGMVDTPLVAEERDDPQLGPLLAQLPIPVGQPGRPEDVAALIAFLLGPDARFFCGSVIWVDGGTDALLRPDDWPAAWVP